jgi:hypothetical protein
METSTDAIYMAISSHVQRLMNRGDFDAAKIVASMSSLPPLLKSLILRRIDTEVSMQRKSATPVQHPQSD